MYYVFLIISLLMDTQIACITPTVDSSAVNTDVQVFLWFTDKEFPRAMPRRDWARS